MTTTLRPVESVSPVAFKGNLSLLEISFLFLWGLKELEARETSYKLREAGKLPLEGRGQNMEPRLKVRCETGETWG